MGQVVSKGFLSKLTIITACERDENSFDDVEDMVHFSFPIKITHNASPAEFTSISFNPGTVIPL